MILVFDKQEFDTEKDPEMVKLQQALDKWDIRRRVIEKRARLLEKPLRTEDAGSDRRSAVGVAGSGVAVKRSRRNKGNQ